MTHTLFEKGTTRQGSKDLDHLTIYIGGYFHKINENKELKLVVNSICWDTIFYTGYKHQNSFRIKSIGMETPVRKNKFLKFKQDRRKLESLYRQLMKHESVPENYKSMLQLTLAKIEKLTISVKKAKFWHYLLRITVFFLSGVATVFLAFKDKNEWISDWALVVTATITFLTSLAAFWSIEEYWLSRKIMLNRVREIQYELLIHASSFIDDKNLTNHLQTLFNQFLSAISDDYWENMLRNMPRRTDLMTSNRESGS